MYIYICPIPLFTFVFQLYISASFHRFLGVNVDAFGPLFFCLPLVSKEEVVQKARPVSTDVGSTNPNFSDLMDEFIQERLKAKGTTVSIAHSDRPVFLCSVLRLFTSIKQGRRGSSPGSLEVPRDLPELLEAGQSPASRPSDDLRPIDDPGIPSEWTSPASASGSDVVSSDSQSDSFNAFQYSTCKFDSKEREQDQVGFLFIMTCFH